MAKTNNSASDAQVSIIMPVYNDEHHVAASLESCLAQTLREIEVIVVDDASTDGTAAIVQRYAEEDGRVRLVSLNTNSTAFHARRVGIDQATAPFVLFIDGDDELAPEAAAVVLEEAIRRTADVVAFGVQVIRPDGTTGGHYERSMQPTHDELIGSDILRSLFPIGKPAQGQLWRYLFNRSLLVYAYRDLPETLAMPRVNDLPIAFLALMRAQKYVSIPQVLYRYYFQRGASGHRVADVSDYEFTASSIRSIGAIEPIVKREAASRPDNTDLEAIYESVRRSVIGRVLEYVDGIADEKLRATCLEMLQGAAGRSNLVYACADFCPKVLPMLAAVGAAPSLSGQDSQHILLRTGNLRTGGVQGVLIAQAAHLIDAGFEVTIAVDADPHTHFHLPDGVDLIRITGESRALRMMGLLDLCKERGIDVIIDHHILYNENWPFFALAANEQGIPTIGWLHTFGLRPILNGSSRTSFLQQYLPLLAMVVALSRTDVAYWKLLGVEDVAYLPNPASPLLAALPKRSVPRPAPVGRLEIVWWGRLEQSSKQVTELIEIGSILADLGVDFRLSIIGPDGADLSADKLNRFAAERGIGSNVVTRGVLHHDELVRAIDNAHVYVSTSIVEGYPLTLVEAQSFGLPLVMYELPWLTTAEGNEGMVTVPQGDRRGAALALATLARDAADYARLSRGALAAAEAAVTFDFKQLYSDLVRGELAGSYQPQPEVADARLLIRQNVLFVERVIEREARALARATRAARDHREKAKRLSRELEDARATIQSFGGLSKNEPKVPSVVRSGFKGWLMGLLPTTMKQSSFYARHQHNTSMVQRNQILAAQAAVEKHLARIDSALVALQSDTRRAGPNLEPMISDRLDRVERAIAASSHEARGDSAQMRGTVEELGAQLGESVHRSRRSEGLLADLNDSVEAIAGVVQRSVENTAKAAAAELENGRALTRVTRAIDEVLWSTVFHDTSLESVWFKDRAVSPGRWAVGYQFLYVLYRILDEVAPTSILELGLGQSSKMTAQYAERSEGVQHVIVEHDPAWISTFAQNFSLPSTSTVVQLDLVDVGISGDATHRYSDFERALGGAEYDLILIDGPFGFDQAVARIDVLDLIPASLGDRFVIMLDDAHRRGERAATQRIVEALNAAGIAHVSGYYRGQKDLWIVVSEDLAHLTTL